MLIVVKLSDDMSLSRMPHVMSVFILSVIMLNVMARSRSYTKISTAFNSIDQCNNTSSDYNQLAKGHFAK